MDVQKRYMLKEIPFHLPTIIHIHEFARNQPTRNASSRHPGMGKGQEMAVEPARPLSFMPLALKLRHNNRSLSLA